MYTIRKKFRVEYAHQLHDAFTKCCYETIHGHSGIVEIFFSSDELDHNDMVVDFGEVSSMIKQYLIDSLDHAIILPKTLDPEYIDCMKKFNKKCVIVDDNPTAEYYAESIYWDVCKIIQPIIDKNDRKFVLSKVRFHETESGYAEYQPTGV